jgi:hypothetical protein
MYSAFPADEMTGAIEMMCYLFTVGAAVIGYLLTLRF